MFRKKKLRYGTAEALGVTFCWISFGAAWGGVGWLTLGRMTGFFRHSSGYVLFRQLEERESDCVFYKE